MLLDVTGCAPSWWQWVISGALVAAGIALTMTGVGGIAGGVLISAGSNSIINSYMNESAGGSSVAGWTGGLISGALSGAGAGLAGSLMNAATAMTGVRCLVSVVGSEVGGFLGGFAGSIGGQVVTAAIDRKKFKMGEAVGSAILTGALSCLGGIGAGMGKALCCLPEGIKYCEPLANCLSLGLSCLTEAVCESLGAVASLF